MDYVAVLVASVYGAGIVSMAVLTVVGLGTAIQAGRRFSTAYLAAVAAVLVELAHISLTV